MPVAKLKASSTPDVMKTEVGNDSLDTIIRQAIGKEPFLSFSRAGDSPVQWIQLLNALDQQELPGWPMLTPVKVQLQKCDKCSREFCSPINYRRHIRVHHRLKKLDKDSTTNRDLLAAYWNKLSVEEAKEVVSFKNVMLEEVPGSSILKAMATLVRKQGFSSLPQYYLKAGSALLDIVQARNSFHISSQELFSVLDDASEKTFLCGAAVSMQKYVFDGEAGKIGLEPKNLVACTSFLLEQILVKAWLAAKDAEALRCQKLLVEEEEAARKRQAEILERKRQRKLRQKEQRAREQRHEDEVEIKEKENVSVTVEAASPAEASLDAFDYEQHNSNTLTDHIASQLVPLQCPDTNEGLGGYSQSGHDCGSNQNIEQRIAQGHNHQRVVVAQGQSQSGVPNGFHMSQNSQTPKLGIIKKYGTYRGQNAAAPLVNGNKVWSRKPKPEIDGIILKAKLQKESDQVKNHEVLIGSIFVALDSYSKSKGSLMSSQDDCIVDNLARESSVQEKTVAQSSNNRLAIKLWRPVSRRELVDAIPVQNEAKEADSNEMNKKGDAENLSDDSGFENNSPENPEDRVGSLQLSSLAAKAFLTQRWKEAISLNHVKLVLSPDSEPPRNLQIQDCEIATCRPSNVDSHGILASAENQFFASSEAPKSKLRMKSEKGIKIKYIPKHKTPTY